MSDHSLLHSSRGDGIRSIRPARSDTGRFLPYWAPKFYQATSLTSPYFLFTHCKEGEET